MNDTLRFVHGDCPPVEELRVFDSLTREFLGTTFTFRVVGSSHYVSAPAYDFYELSSCEPVAAEDATTVPLVTDGDGGGTSGDHDSDGVANVDLGGDGATDADARRLGYESDRIACETIVERRPLSAFPRERSFDLAYRFEPDAYTTIDVGTRGYETYHTYPEFDLALYTETVFQRVPGRTY